NARKNELAYHQEAVVAHCTAFPFNTVYLWEKAKRFFLTEARGTTLLTPNYDLDSRYLLHGTSRTQSAPYNNRAQRPTQGNTCHCFNWNRTCEFGRVCKFKHECELCGSDHLAKTCPSRSNNENYTYKREINQAVYAVKRQRTEKGGDSDNK